MEDGYKIQVLYNGLMPESMRLVNASARGSLNYKSMVKVMELFKKIAENGCSGSNERRMPMRKQVRIMEVDANANFGT